jgi:type IV pilus assembly protein PilW
MNRPCIREGAGQSKSPAGRTQAGLTLVELMISMTLGLFVVMAATALLISAKSSYIVQDDSAHLQDTGRFAVEIIARSLRQVSYENWDPTEGPVVAASSMGANISGWDARSLKGSTPGIASPVAKSINGSDVLAVRFFGSGAGDNGNGTMTNCAGFGVAAALSSEVADESRGWSIFYVAEDATGESELYCKYLGDSNWTSQAIARGVESFQVLYGLDTDEDGVPNQFLNATAMNALDDALILQGGDPREKAADKSRRSYWKKIVTVRIALLVRGAQITRNEKLTNEYDLFGKDYADAYAAVDPGVRIREAALSKSVRGRERRIFTATIQLRNRLTRPAGKAT